MRDDFEAAYAARMTDDMAAAKPITADSIRSLRQDDHYGRHRKYLNECWRYWQERGRLPR